MHPMELLGNVGHVEPRLDLFGDSVTIGSEIVLDTPDKTPR